MISIVISNSLNNESKEFVIQNRLKLSTVVPAEVYKYLTDFVNDHYERDIRFYYDIHRNYVEEDIFKDLV